METFKVALTVTETVSIVGFVTDTDEKSMVSNLTPELIKRWGEGNFVIDSIEIADPEEAKFVEAEINQSKKELN